METLRQMSKFKNIFKFPNSKFKFKVQSQNSKFKIEVQSGKIKIYPKSKNDTRRVIHISPCIPSHVSRGRIEAVGDEPRNSEIHDHLRLPPANPPSESSPHRKTNN